MRDAIKCTKESVHTKEILKKVLILKPLSTHCACPQVQKNKQILQHKNLLYNKATVNRVCYRGRP